MRKHLMTGAVCVALSACETGTDDASSSSGGAQAKGNAQIFLEAEDTIPEGLEPGDGEENIQDGWTVRYDKFLAVVGNFRATSSANSQASLAKPDVLVVDLRSLPVGGLVLAEFTDVAAIRYDRVGYDIPNASASSTCAPGISADDCAMMKQNGYSIFIEGVISKTDGQSCSPTQPNQCVAAAEVRFRWGLAAGTAFDDCAPPEGDSGFSIPTGGTAQVKPTIHGDHWFFTNITQGEEITERKAQWIANGDLDHDGETTLAELGQVAASDVFPASEGYNLSGAIIPVNTARDYVEAQARTLGDFQGEGECPTRRILD
ncbi:MAG: hypothetical protein AB2A00_10540 [Myxococcota bacterium]